MSKALIEFNLDETSRWLVINDGVMGGLSQGQFIGNGAQGALFQGEVSLANNGGFTSVRSQPRDYDLAGYRGIRLKVRGDGNAYQFRLQAHERIDDISYRYRFDTRDGEWQNVEMPFSAFVPVYRGRELPRQPVSPARIRQLGFLIADGQAGAFRLEIGGIEAYR